MELNLKTRWDDSFRTSSGPWAGQPNGVRFFAGATNFTLIDTNKNGVWGTQGLLPSSGMMFFHLGQIGRGYVV